MMEHLAPERQATLRTQFVTGHIGLIGALDVEYLGEGLIDFTPFPAVLNPDSQEEPVRLVIPENKRIIFEGRQHSLGASERIILNALLLLKGQFVTTGDLAATGLTPADVQKTATGLQKLNKGSDASRFGILHDTVWREPAYAANSAISIIDTRSRIDTRRVFKIKR